jgi:hypothetical protein
MGGPMKSVRPKRAAPIDPKNLSPEEGFVVSRIDGTLSVNDLAVMTGLEAPKVERIVQKLAAEGALTLEDAESSGYLPEVGSAPSLPDSDDGTTSLADFAAALGMDPSAFVVQQAAPVKERPVAENRVENKSNHPPPLIEEPMELEEIGPGDEEPAAELEEIGPGDEAPAELEEVTEEAPPEGEQALNEEIEANERNFRQLYMTKFHALPTDARVGHAQTESGNDLFALCFDPEPRVIAAIVENPSCGLDHVRLIAQHHRTATGLEILSRRQEFIRDSLVERRLLRNPQCGDQPLNRIMASKRLLQTYKIVIDRDIPELTRTKSRGHLRKKWQSGTPEERADIVLRTEARCLTFLTGCTFDARSTQILCGKQYNSVLFIQNIAKFPAAPPALLAHLVKQPFVRKILPLKKLLLQHPNMPGEVKRTI